MATEEAQANRKELRPHQERAIAMLRHSLAGGHRRVVLQGPTGFGKTLVAARIIDMAREKGRRVIFTAPAISLINQTVRAFEREGVSGIGVMQANHPRTDRFAPVQIASVQTLARRDIPEAALVIVDECHIRSAIIDRMMDEMQGVYFVGLTATPWAKGMGWRWQDLVVPTTIADLIRDGFLSQFVAYAPDVPDLSGVKVKAGEYVEDALSQVMGDAKLLGSVVRTWLEKGENRPTLCFAVNRRHAADLADEFGRNGVATAYVDGETDSVSRDLIGKRFTSGEVRVICSVRTMTTGVDLPVSCIIDAAPTLSEMLHVQKLGRGLRINPGTEDLVILDHAGNCLRLGLPTDIHHAALDRSAPGTKQETRPVAEKLPKPCVECQTLHIGRLCPCCGHERRPVAGVETREGDLVPLRGKAQPPSKADKQAFYSMALSLAQTRGKTPGYAAGLYKGRFGVWPRGMEERLVPPDMAFLNWEKSRRIAYAKRMEAQRGAA